MYIKHSSRTQQIDAIKITSFRISFFFHLCVPHQYFSEYKTLTSPSTGYQIRYRMLHVMRNYVLEITSESFDWYSSVFFQSDICQCSTHVYASRTVYSTPWHSNIEEIKTYSNWYFKIISLFHSNFYFVAFLQIL